MNRPSLILAALLALPRFAAAQAPDNAMNDDRATTLGTLRTMRDNLRNQATTSHSGQFIVFASPRLLPPPPALATDPGLIVLDSKLLVVSAERIKQSVWRMLDTTAPWSGRIVFNLRSARSADDPIMVVAGKRPGGWTYQVELPNCLERTRFVRTIVDLVLLELANRNAGTRSAEIPAWLAEGLSQELFVAEGPEVILPPPNDVENGLNLRRFELNARRTNAVAIAEESLRRHPALTYEQLSWPTDENLSGEGGVAFRSSAQLFVDQLLALPGGAASLRATLENLAYYYNWQFAFLHGFRSHFESALDVEKWWALQLVQFTGRDILQFWTADESWRRLDDIVHAPVEVRPSPNELPLRTDINLQVIVREWDLVSQERILQRKLQQLDLLRTRVAPALAALVDDYRRALGGYLQKRYARGKILPWRKTTGRIVDGETEDMVRELNGLDARRNALKPASAPALTASLEAPAPPGR